MDIYILFADMRSQVSPGVGAEFLSITSVSVWMSSCMCVFPWQNRLSRLANWITLLRAKSLAAEIKQLCFVVTVHEILFKNPAPFQKPAKYKKKCGAGGGCKGRTEPPQNLLEQNATCSFGNVAENAAF